MKTKEITRVMAAIVVMLTISFNIHAQLGGAINRATRNATQQATRNANQQRQQQTQQQTQQADQQTEQTQQTEQQTQQTDQQTQQPTRQQTRQAARQAATQTQAAVDQSPKPSDAAIAADPRASITTVEEGYSKSPAQIRVAYEKLKAERYLRPYYNSKLRRFYLLDDSQAELDFFEKSAKTVDAFRSLWRKESYFYEGKIELDLSIRESALQNYMSVNSAAFSLIDTIPAGNRTPWDCYDDCTGVMPIGIHVIYAGYALFAADPQGLKPFMRFCEARNVRNSFRAGIISISASDGMTLRSGGKLPVKWDYLTDVCNDTYDLERLTENETPISVIKEAATFYRDQVAKYDAAKDIGNTRYYFHLFEIAMFYWQNNKKLVKEAPDYDALLVEYVRYSRRYPEWFNSDLSNLPAVDMPQTYRVDATLAAKALEVAKKQFENRANPFKVDRVVFLSQNWAEAKETKHPYRTTQRAHSVGLLTNENGKWIMRGPWQFVQPSDLKGGWTNEYRYQAGMSGDANRPQAVNYKP